MKVALCVQVKLENNYIREWIGYHKKLGFNNIIIYDNNDFQGENLNDVIDDYIKSKYVIVDKSFMNYKFVQIESYNKCINKYRNKYDWICFIDLDEFIYINDFNTIQEFLSSNDKFGNFDSIALQWVTYKDNGYVEVSSHSVLKNYDHPLNITNNPSMQSLFKTIINCNSIKRYDSLFFGDAHKLANPGIKLCDTDGNYLHFLNSTIQPNTNHIYIKHFITKSLSEFINQKISRGINWEKYENSEIYDLYKDINGWNNEYKNYIDYKINNINRINKILICIFTNNENIVPLIEKTYLNTIKEYDNIDYKIINDNYNFGIYYNVFKEIYENGNIYDSIVCVNQQTFINIHLLNRFINILSDDDTIYTNILQIRLTNKDICERFFILSKKHIEQLITDEIYNYNPDCLSYFPYYTLSMLLNKFNTNIFKSLGNIDIICYNNIYELNEKTESIISWTYNDIITDDNILDLTTEYNNLNNFINQNKYKFILRVPDIKLGHFNYYKELSDGNGECQFIGNI